MPKLAIARMATANPMGAEVYQQHIIRRAADALANTGADWTSEELIARSLRSPLPGNRRLPVGWLMNASPRARRSVGRVVYPSGSVLHRMNLELPPGPDGNVVTLHDLVAWEQTDESSPVRAAAEELRQADAVICVSQFTADRATEIFDLKHPYVVPNGVDDVYLNASPLSSDALESLGLHQPFVLTTGGVSARKNLESLADAWPHILRSRPELTLVLTGSEHPRRTSLFGPLPNVALLGRVADSLLPGLMAAAQAVIIPSLVEGFGLPALEGMAAGTVVVAARTSSLPEVVGDCGILVEPTPQGIAGGVIDATSDDASLAQISSAGRQRAETFTWERSAAGHAAVWARVAAATK